MADINIEYNEKTGRFVITSPPWVVGRIRGMPNRRWEPKRRLWTAPAIRINAQYITEHLSDAALTPEAQAAVLNAARRAAVTDAAKFPRHYVFKTEPYKHQRDALNKMFPNGAFALFMDMRTGKSKVCIDYAAAHHRAENLDGAVVVCPYSIRKNWERELGDHCPVDFSAHVLDTSKKKEYEGWLASASGFRWLIVGVESLASGSASACVERFLLTSTKMMMVIDESHTIKTPSANRSKECVRLGKMAERRVIMTGTAVSNSPMDLFMQFEFLDPNIIGTGDFYSFRNRYAIMGGYEGKQVVGYQNMPELMEIIAPFVYQVSRSDVFDLPPVIRTTRTVKMGPEQKKLYNSMSRQKYVCTEGGVLTAQTVLEKMLRLQEIAGGIISYEVLVDGGVVGYKKERIDGRSCKVQEMMALLEEVAGSVIVWCSRRGEIDMVVEALVEKYGRDQVVEMHGGVSSDDRHLNVYDLFQTGKARFMVANQTVGGVGFKMSKADTVIYYSNTFSYIDRIQSMDRTQSADQTKSVLYVDLISEGTVDELVLEALSNKKDVSQYVSSSIKEISRRLELGV